MALPLPRVVSDVGPGGPLVTAMGGMNSLANENILRQINQIKKQYLPTTLGAEAASKLAYANLMGPQFLAKLLASDSAVANMGDPAAKAALEKAVGAGMGRNSGMNAFNQMQQGNQGNSMFSGIGEPSTNSFSGHLKNAFRALIGQNPQQGPNQNAFNMPAQDYDNSSNPRVSAEGPGVIPNGDFPFVGREGYRPHPTTTDYDGNQMQIDMTGGQPGQQSNEWGASTPEAQRAFAQGREPSYAENTGTYKGAVAEGLESGKIRAKDIEELNNTVFNAENNANTLNKINDILGSPEFEEIRNTPLAGHHELAYYAKEGTKAQQTMVGRFYTLTGNIIKDASRDFAGQFRKGEQVLLQSMKAGPSDTVDSAKGKMATLTELNKMLMERSRLTSKYMSANHANKLEASEWADKQIDGDAIRKEANDRLNPKRANPSNDDIDFTAQKYNMTRQQVIERLKSEGKYHG